MDTIESVGTYLALPRFNRRYGAAFDGVAWYYQEAEYEQSKTLERYALEETRQVVAGGHK